MNGILNKNQLTFVKEKEFNIPLIHKIDSIIVNCYRDCHNKNNQPFEYKYEFDIELTNITSNGIIKIIISDKSLSLYELNKKLIVARQRGYIYSIKKTNSELKFLVFYLKKIYIII